MRLAGLALLLAALLAAPAGAAETKYSLANGCFDVDGGPGGPYRMKATALGQYLLYTKDGKYLTSNGDAAEPADEPSAAGEWRASEEGGDAEAEVAGVDRRTDAHGRRPHDRLRRNTPRSS